MKTMGWKKLIVALMTAVVAVISPAVTVSAAESSDAEVPYQTFTYDKWGNATPAPNGYLPEKSINGSSLGVGDFSEPQDMFYCKARHEIYIADSGNMRIVVTDENFNLIRVITELTWNDSPYQLQYPTGVFVKDDGTIYIADQKNAEVIMCGQDGVIQQKFGKPDSNLIDPNLEYKPSKVVADKVGKVYVQSVGVFQGLIYLKPDGTFVKYFGANKVEMTMKRIIMKLWKTILSSKASANMQSFNPIEYGNVYLDSQGFIFATAAASQNNSKLIVKLNPLGVDISRLGNPIWYFKSTFADVTVDEEDNITAVDAKNGKIYQSDKNGQLMFAFGGIGEQLGLFKIPSSIIEVNNKLYILDSDKRSITQFGLTSFGEKVRTAISLYNHGLYQDSVSPWKEVIRLNANYLLAYTGLGKAYYQLEDYKTSMDYYKLANDRSNYSTAYKEYSLLAMRNNFGKIILFIISIAVLYKGLRIYLKKRRKVREGKA
jgi:tetratricopeptide (TPR) repeat protein